VALERVEVGQVLVRHQLQGGRREKMERKKMMAWHLTCTTPNICYKEEGERKWRGRR
jgi:hypothetical protein